MSAKRRRRPSAAMVVAILALVVAMTGSAVAATMIDGSSIKKDSIPGNRLIDHTLTGQQINLSKLGTVPEASSAKSAKTAANAVKLGGRPAASYLPASAMVRWDFTMNLGDSPRTFSYGPLRFHATCTNDSGNTKGWMTVTTTEKNTYVSGDTEDEPGTGTLISPGDTPYVITGADSTTADDGNSGELAAFDSAGKIAIFSTAQTFGVAINTPGANCRFFGYLINDA